MPGEVLKLSTRWLSFDFTALRAQAVVKWNKNGGHFDLEEGCPPGAVDGMSRQR